jgi:hypothetical protein
MVLKSSMDTGSTLGEALFSISFLQMLWMIRKRNSAFEAEVGPVHVHLRTAGIPRASDQANVGRRARIVLGGEFGPIRVLIVLVEEGVILFVFLQPQGYRQLFIELEGGSAVPHAIFSQVAVVHHAEADLVILAEDNLQRSPVTCASGGQRYVIAVL